MNNEEITYARWLLSKTTKVGECLICHLSKASNGYSKLDGGEGAHRFILRTFKGIPNGLYALHTCDNRGCINPEHLYAGTPQQNVDDRRTRNPMPIPGRPRLYTVEQEAEMVKLREQGLSYQEIAQRYNINKGTVRLVILRSST